MDDNLPQDSKLTSTKRKWADEGKFLTGRHARPDTDRLPPGQHLVKNWPVLDLGQQPSISPSQWKLDIYGLVNKPTTFNWESFGSQNSRDRICTDTAARMICALSITETSAAGRVAKTWSRQTTILRMRSKLSSANVPWCRYMLSAPTASSATVM